MVSNRFSILTDWKPNLLKCYTRLSVFVVGLEPFSEWKKTDWGHCRPSEQQVTSHMSAILLHRTPPGRESDRMAFGKKKKEKKTAVNKMQDYVCKRQPGFYTMWRKKIKKKKFWAKKSEWNCVLLWKKPSAVPQQYSDWSWLVSPFILSERGHGSFCHV